jgi:adenosylmethionine-8-amino-7-oxononanoate aminotransferase
MAEAIRAQLGRLEAYSTFGDLANEPATRLASLLSELAPVEDGRVFLTSGGGDSVDTAVKLARRYWRVLGQEDRKVILSRRGSYHGTHGFGTSITGLDDIREGYGPLLVDTQQVERDSAEALEATIAELGAANVAAFFVEPVTGAGGVYPPSASYMEAVGEVCRRSGVLLVVDAVICGFGRLGTWFGAERWNVSPDMIVFAKGVTSGYLPLGGVVVSWRVAEPFWTDPSVPILRHGATYAGHPVCCAAALKNIEILDRDGLIGRGRDLEAPLFDALSQLTTLSGVDEVRGGVGAMAAVEVSAELLSRNPAAPSDIAMKARDHGLLVRGLASSVCVSPPLTATDEHIELIADGLGSAFAEAEADVGLSRAV